jgi:protein TonB
MSSHFFILVRLNIRSFILSLIVHLFLFFFLFIPLYRSEGQINRLQTELVKVHLRDNQPENHQAKRPIPQGFNRNQDLISKAEPPLKEGFKEVTLETQTSVDTKNQVSEAMNTANKEGISLSSRSEGVKEGATPKTSEPSGKVEEAQFSIISKLVREHLEYPYLARRMGWEGEVLLFFRLNPTGEVEEIKVLKSSGFEVLDKSAVNAVKRASKHFPRPKQIVLIKLPIQFKLEKGGI